MRSGGFGGSSGIQHKKLPDPADDEGKHAAVDHEFPLRGRQADPRDDTRKRK